MKNKNKLNTDYKHVKNKIYYELKYKIIIAIYRNKMKHWQGTMNDNSIIYGQQCTCIINDSQ